MLKLPLKVESFTRQAAVQRKNRSARIRAIVRSSCAAGAAAVSPRDRVAGKCTVSDDDGSAVVENNATERRATSATGRVRVAAVGTTVSWMR